MPPAAKQRVAELLDSGRLFRYQGRVDDVADLEREFTSYIGLPYTMACNSGGCGIFLSLKALGVKPGDKVLVNAFTLSPVPGAVVHACASPVFVRSEPETLAIDLDHLCEKASESGARVLIVSYMRGQVPNIDRLIATTKRLGLEVIEDCAHTLGATWKPEGSDQHLHLGAFGALGVWSLQTNKAINCGEGGLISTSRQDLASFITVATGSYGHFALNGASGDREHTAKLYPGVPNMSMRMTAIAAALARPQLENLPAKMERWSEHARILRGALGACKHVRCVAQPAQMVCAWSSIQMEFVDFSPAEVAEVIATLAQHGVPLAWFGGPWKGFTSTLKDWKFADPEGQQWSECREHHETFEKSLVDLPLYHTAQWSNVVIERIAELLVDTISRVAGKFPQKAVSEAGPGLKQAEPVHA